MVTFSRTLSLQLMLAIGLGRSHVAAEDFGFLSFNSDKFESGNIQQEENLSHTEDLHLHGGTQIEKRA